MKNLIILDRYYPVPHANGLCIDSIIKHFSNSITDIICRIDIPLNKPCLFPEYIANVYPVIYKHQKPYQLISIFKKLVYIINHLFSCFFLPIYDVRFTKKLYYEAKRRVRTTQYDNIICVINPIEAAEAGYRIKKAYPDVNLILYDVDTVSNCDLGPIKKRFYSYYHRKVLEWEKKVYSVSDLIIHLENHKKHFLGEPYAHYIDKTLFQGLPLLNEINTLQIAPKRNLRKKIVYSGSFYSQLREPDYLINIINSLADQDFFFEIYTDDEHKEFIQSRIKSLRCVVHGYVSQEQLNSIIMSSDFVISMGNTKVDLFPSKIIYYISTLKPIIHIAQNNEDPVINCLKNYPDALLISTSEIFETNIRVLSDYLQRFHDTIDKAIVWEKYKKYDPKEAAKEICEHLKSDNE